MTHGPPATADVELNVVIPTRDRPDSLARALESLAAAHEVESSSRVIVVENGSEVSGEVVNRFRAVLPIEYLHTSVAGKSRALNLALETMERGLVVWFDDDVVAEPQVLEAYASAARLHGPGHYFGGVHSIGWTGEPNMAREGYFVRSMVPSTSTDRGAARVMTRRLFFGFNWACWLEDIRRVGGFDARFGPGGTAGATGQESEAQHRLLRAGVVPVLVPGAAVEHVVEVSQTDDREILKRRVRSGTEAGLFARMGYGSPPTRLLAGQAIWLLRSVGSILRHPLSDESWFRLRVKLAYIRGIVRGLIV